MLRICLILFFAFVSIANADIVDINTNKLINQMYEKMGVNIATKIFKDKESLNKLLIILNDSYDLGLNRIDNLYDFQVATQSKLIRQNGKERTEIENKTGNLGIIDAFKPANISDLNISSVSIPVLLGNTYKGMEAEIKALLALPNAKKRMHNYYALVSDRIFSPEDFLDNNAEMSYNMMANKNHDFKGYRTEIINAVNDYFSDDTTFFVIKKYNLYNKIITLVNPDLGSAGVYLLKEFEKHMNDFGYGSNQANMALNDYRAFLFTKGIKYLPTEQDMLGLLFIKHGVNGANIIFSATQYRKQNRATAIDTYVNFLDFIKKKKLDLSKIVLIGINMQIYRQWFEFIKLANLSSGELPKFGSVPINGEINNSDMLADEFARLVYDITF